MIPWIWGLKTIKFKDFSASLRSFCYCLDVGFKTIYFYDFGAWLG